MSFKVGEHKDFPNLESARKYIIERFNCSIIYKNKKPFFIFTKSAKLKVKAHFSIEFKRNKRNLELVHIKRLE